MRRSVRIALAIAGFSVASACGLDLSGVGDQSSTGTDGGGGATADGNGGPGASEDSSVSTGDDASTDDDGDAADSGSLTKDSSAPDSGERDSGRDADIDAGDAGILYRCPAGGNVTDCADCTGNPLFCEMCGAGPARDHVCVPKGSSCKMTYTLPGYTWCPCQNGDASTCDIPQQECNTMVNGCVTCGENLTDGYECKANTKCNQGAAKCE